MKLQWGLGRENSSMLKMENTLHEDLGTQKGKNADCVDMIKKTVYTLCVTVLS